MSKSREKGIIVVRVVRGTYYIEMYSLVNALRLEGENKAADMIETMTLA